MLATQTPNLTAVVSADYQRIEEAILYLEQNFRRQPDLSEIAGSVGLSEYHFQRLFSRWAGISPKRFLQFLTLNYAKKLLAESKSLLDVTYEAGLSGPSRLHDLFITHEAITPGQYKKKGADLTIRYGFQATPFGDCLLAITERGICGLAFGPLNGRDQALTELQNEWPQARFYEDRTTATSYIEQIFSPPAKRASNLPLKLYLQGTNFQVKVWQALLQIPPGAVASYGMIARLVGQPTAVRAIGNATGRNPIAYIIPCHRVIRQVGAIGDYRWGSARKKAILGWEAGQRYLAEAR